ncbi:MAG: hypothetical protein AAF389_18395 [Gemmatimonadota bacterium]
MWTEQQSTVGTVDLTIGVAEGAEPEVFGSIGAVAVDDGGQIFLLDAMAQEVRLFSADGVHVVTFGRRGEGPAEFGYAEGLLLSPDGSLWVSDVRRQRTLRFDPGGDLLGAVSTLDPLAPLPVPTAVAPDGTLSAWRFTNVGRDYSVSMHAGSHDLYEPLSLDPTTGEVEMHAGTEVEVSRVGGVRVPLGGIAATAAASDGSFWFSHPTDYVLYQRSSAGDTLLVVSLEDAPRAAIPTQVRDSLARGLAEAAQRFGRSGALPGSEHFPETYRAVDRIFATADRRLYVVGRVEGAAAGEFLDVFEADSGRYLGRISLPIQITRRTVLSIVGDALYAAVPSEVGAPTLVRVRLPRLGV